MEFNLTRHIAVNVQQYEAAVPFYKNVLGWELIKTNERETHFKKGEMNFYIEKQPSEPYLAFFEYEIADMAAAKKELMEAGCMVRETYGEKSVMFTDPFGMHFHVYEKGTPL